MKAEADEFDGHDSSYYGDDFAMIFSKQFYHVRNSI